MKQGLVGTVGFLVLVVVLLGVLRWKFGGVAPTPEAFAAHTSLEAALTQSEQTGKPVLVMATADWCMPCQVLKRGALADPRVTAWINENAIAAYADFTDSNTPEAQQAQRLLAVDGYPTLLFVRDGEVVSRKVGVASAGSLLEWFETVGG